MATELYKDSEHICFIAPVVIIFSERAGSIPTGGLPV